MGLLSLPERFWKYVDKTEECWNWTGGKSTAGYGYFQIGGRGAKKRPAHCLAYEALIGPIPLGYDLDHLCRNRGCVRPDHGEPVTRRINLLRGETITARNASMTACPWGHPYDLINTLYYQGGRQCRACRNLRSRDGWRIV